jgi:DNA mismatch repair protein MutL
MSSIRKLDQHVVALIAAGEVVERPVSAVKELAENAIDAGATSITIDIQRGGFDLVRIRDNGTGIDPADLTLALERHATSKLIGADALYNVRTLGFRGEALASIAAVSRLRIVTRTASQSGGRIISATAGTIEDHSAVAAPIGTTVSVEDLFFNVPARQAFQRSPAGESRAIVQLITQLALASPTIRWRVSLDGRDALVTPGSGSVREVLVAVHGAPIAMHVLDLPALALPQIVGPVGSMTVSGVTTSPTVHRNTRMHCTFIVNGRVVRSTSLSHAVDEAYHALLPHGRHPIAVISIAVPPSDVDVNVHPTKLEVRLQHERLAYARVRDAVRRALEGHAPAPTVAPTIPEWDDRSDHPLQAARTRTGLWIASALPHRNQAGDIPGGSWPFTRPLDEDDNGPLADLAEAGPRLPVDAPELPGAEAQSEGEAGELAVHSRGDEASSLHVRSGATEVLSWRPLGQVGLTYVVVEAPDGMYLIDQHSAHERVQYEALKSATSQVGPLLRQPLLVPETVELTAAQGAWLRGNIDVLASLGYELEPFGDAPAADPWLVRAVPWAVAARRRRTDIASLIDGLIDHEYGDGPVEDQARWAVACHASVRAGDRLSLPEMQALLEQLSRCDLRQTCPHGRPTMIHMSHSQLAREFGRSSPVRTGAYTS